MKTSSTASAKPIRSMGRFVHEAVAVDPATGIVYEGEGEWELFLAMEQALQAFKTPKAFAALKRSGMKRDFSWESSANAYAETYSWAIDARSKVT